MLSPWSTLFLLSAPLAVQGHNPQAPFAPIDLTFDVDSPKIDLSHEPWTAKYGPQVDLGYTGVLSFSHLNYVKCLEDASVPFDIGIIGFPFDTATSYRPGARFGPYAIRSGSRRQTLGVGRGYTLAWGSNPVDFGSGFLDCGDVPISPYDNAKAIDQMEAAYSTLLARPVLGGVSEKYRERTRSFALDGKEHPRIITLGGDHTIVLPILRALNKVYGPVSVIHFDAHLDTWPSTGNAIHDGITHGTFFSVAAEEGLMTNTSIHAGIRCKMWGIGDIEHDDTVGFQVISTEDIDDYGIKKVIEKMRNRIGDKPVYLSFDIDVIQAKHQRVEFDIGLEPAQTGTPEAGGWTMRECFSSIPFPPGPKPWPIIGNLLDFPRDKAHLAYLKMGQQAQSDIIYLNVIGMNVVVLNSAEAVNDLFVGKGKLYSDRPPLPMVTLSGLDYPFIFFSYGNKWRSEWRNFLVRQGGRKLKKTHKSEHRSMFTQEMSPQNLETVLKPQFQESLNKFLYNLLDTPQNFESHAHFLSGGFILSLAYGISIHDPQDYYLNLVMEMAKLAAQVVIPGKYLVDTFPSLRCVKKMLEEPLAFAKKNMEKGTSRSSMASRILQQMHDEGTWSEEQEEALKDVLGTLYGAGTDTTATTVVTMILALVLYPDILKKGQAAVDAVVGSDRLPNSGDEGNIPYVDALLMEALRWRPVSLLGVPHYVQQTNVYRGYCIPAKTMVFGNIWALLHDPATYGEDVDQFRPERFLNPDGTLNDAIPYPNAAFGFGRRVCAGKTFVQSALWVTVASLLSCFDFSTALDKNGDEIHPSTNYRDLAISEPQPFECVIRPRSKVVAELIRQIQRRE
ncbi:hypothetical protein D9757_008813 [Collybiopsis confluens]|uniref:Cytochrome P450 n=1 Tax=Collybiopsis confluens TaxID=2823264 RepID=A0A8H5H3Z7_9AGAR|nr:hypothetical protein D9757_008813 [Collybiopsis confluens]